MMNDERLGALSAHLIRGGSVALLAGAMALGCGGSEDDAGAGGEGADAGAAGVGAAAPGGTSGGGAASGGGGADSGGTGGASGSAGSSGPAGAGGGAGSGGAAGASGSSGGAGAGGTASDPSGQSIPVGDLPGWRQIFMDDFSEDVALGSFPDAVSDRWDAYPYPWNDTSGNGFYDPGRVVSIHDGVMDLYLHTEGGEHLVSAPRPVLPAAEIAGTTGLLYGRYAIRFRADPVPGYKTAWLLWPDSGDWPHDGEIDFPEGNLDGTISAFMHRQDGTSGSDQDAHPTDATYSDWHTAIIEWSSLECRFILDGTTIGVSTDRIPSTPMHWVIQTETALDGTEPSDAASGHVEIDWVAVWVPS